MSSGYSNENKKLKTFINLVGDYKQIQTSDVNLHVISIKDDKFKRFIFSTPFREMAIIYVDVPIGVLDGVIECPRKIRTPFDTRLYGVVRISVYIKFQEDKIIFEAEHDQNFYLYYVANM